MQMEYSFIIPVYNRPNEIEELLESFSNLEGNINFEIVIVEDGSNIPSEAVIKEYVDRLNISYYYKNNSGPGDSRNYGMLNAHSTFTNLQKAINFSMTSFITTGGIRGSKNSIDKFQPRSFNMGLSKKAFEVTNGFGRIHPGEDPDLSIRLWNKGFETKLIPEAYVYHKRRISWSKFYKQVFKFGSVRPILNFWHPETKKLTYWFPSLFVLFSI